jgi:hypothetical protein
MIPEPQACEACGAIWHDGQTCTDHFHTLLYWEFDLGLFDVHHLMVAAYHMQHPALYSPETLSAVQGLLVQWVEQGRHPHETRREISASVQSGVREFKVTGTPEHHGAYNRPVAWTMRVGDVVSAGSDAYYASVQAWAASVLVSLRAAGEIAG